MSYLLWPANLIFLLGGRCNLSDKYTIRSITAQGTQAAEDLLIEFRKVTSSVGCCLNGPSRLIPDQRRQPGLDQVFVTTNAHDRSVSTSPGLHLQTHHFEQFVIEICVNKYHQQLLTDTAPPDLPKPSTSRKQTPSRPIATSDSKGTVLEEVGGRNLYYPANDWYRYPQFKLTLRTLAWLWFITFMTAFEELSELEQQQRS